jgi:hypothetical protein
MSKSKDKIERIKSFGPFEKERAQFLRYLNRHWWEAWIALRESRYREGENGVGGEKLRFRGSVVACVGQIKRLLLFSRSIP